MIWVVNAIIIVLLTIALTSKYRKDLEKAEEEIQVLKENLEKSSFKLNARISSLEAMNDEIINENRKLKEKLSNT